MRRVYILAACCLLAAFQNNGVGAPTSPGVSPDGLQKNLNTDDAGNLLLAPGQLQCIVGSDGGITINDGAVYILGGDGGVPAIPFSNTQAEFVCCGTSATAFPTALAGRTGLVVQNDGPIAYVNVVTPLTTNTPGNMALGPGTPGASPGDSQSWPAASNVTFYCVAPVAQVDGGCLQVLEVK